MPHLLRDRRIISGHTFFGASLPDAIVQREGHALLVTMNRPQRMNALSGAMLVRMYDAYQLASRDPEIRCIIVTGAGGNFSAGADLRAMSGDAGNSDPEIDVQARMAADPDLAYKALFRHYRPTKPIIAAVEGVAIAGGTEILQAMEIRVAGESARFGVSEARWSLYPMGGSAVRLPRQIPYTLAADILLTGRHIDAHEALRIGLVGYVVPDGQALAKAREIAEVICANGPLAVEAITRTLHETDGMELEQALRHEWDYGRAVFESADAKEGPLAFSQKRKPKFRRA
jgi:enoyl-CoA hydratase